MAKVAVMGAGSWGTALALQLSQNAHEVWLWGHNPQHIQALCEHRANQRYLPHYAFPPNLRPTADLAEALRGAELLLIVVPSHAFSETLARLKRFASDEQIPLPPIMWAIKGFEAETGRLLTEVFHEHFGEHSHAILAGPSFAKEVAAQNPTAVTIAARRTEEAQRFAQYVYGKRFLCYTSTDLIGVQIGGAVKNVIAIATGIADGLGLGANTRALLITRGLHEIRRLNNALGGERETLMGLAGLGDLMLTCTDNQSRNRRFGLLLGAGKSALEAKAEIGQTVEGEGAAFDAFQLAKRFGVYMPITEHLVQLLSGEIELEACVQSLLNRSIKTEYA
ncbi:MAG: NAD(P)H-dependent glycerol-3-phosphate dehydrogenase [Cardiobacteriaceae bacterium]|nr:NAD(P)H-dependent glycerol-3-phosphate dehydrogenase [Cardiobacteriaceae bacterium]